jgi:hypothetical protein
MLPRSAMYALPLSFLFPLSLERVQPVPRSMLADFKVAIRDPRYPVYA